MADRLALVFEQPSMRDDYPKVSAYVRRVDESGDIGWEYSSEFNAIEGFTAKSFGYSSDRTGFTSWDNIAEPRRSGEVNEAEAERIHKLLKSARVKLARMVEAGYGEPATFGAYVARCAKALGVKWIGFYPPFGRARWANGDRFMLKTLADGQWQIDNIIRDWRDQTGQYAKEAVYA